MPPFIVPFPSEEDEEDEEADDVDDGSYDVVVDAEVDALREADDVDDDDADDEEEEEACRGCST